MQINVLVDKKSDEQAKWLREMWYPTTNSNQTRDAFIFNDAIDRFKGSPEDLLEYIESGEENETVQRKVTIKSESNDRLKTIAAAINKPVTTTYRAIIAYTIANLPTTEKEETAEPVGVSQLLVEKISLLEKQMEACNQTLKEIKELTK